jgi:CRP-like cAMP-binding protein
VLATTERTAICPTEVDMNIQPADYLVHLSNVLMLVSYSVRDMLWLRWFAVAAAMTNIPYFLVQADILWPPVVWACVFTAINVWQIGRIYLERRPVVLSADEQRLYDFGFRALRPREFLSLVLVGEWRTAAHGEKVVEEGKRVDAICIAISGSAEVRRRGQRIGALGPGNVIGTALALTGEPSPIEASFSESARYIRWPLESLRAFVDRRPELRAVLQRFLNRDLSTKVETLVTTARTGSRP